MSYKGFFPSGGPSIMRVMADHYVHDNQSDHSPLLQRSLCQCAPRQWSHRQPHRPKPDKETGTRNNISKTTKTCPQCGRVVKQRWHYHRGVPIVDKKGGQRNRLSILRHKPWRRQNDLWVPMVRTQKPRDRLEGTRTERRASGNSDRGVSL